MTDSQAPLAAPAEHVLDTLYVNNLNEKVSLNKLKAVLNLLFGRYGKVIQITAHRNLKMKGQAFVTYADPKSSDKALRKLQGRPVFKKPIRITWAKASSDEYHRLLQNFDAIAKRQELKKERERLRKEKEQQKPQTPQPGTSQMSKSQIKQWKSLPPNNILLLQNLADHQLSNEVLDAIFSVFNGFERVRLIKFRKLAFVDFDTEANATACLEKLGNSDSLENALLTYAKK